jgi:hypothetical protein
LSHLRSPTGLYDEPKILPYAKASICPKGADVKHNVTYGILYPAARELDEVTRAFTRILREVADENVASIA